METVIYNDIDKTFDQEMYIKGDALRKPIFDLVKKDYPRFTKDSFLSRDKLKNYRQLYLSNLVKEQTGDFDKLEHEVVEAVSGEKLLSDYIEDDLDESFTRGQKLADKIAEFGGSWTFIIVFLSLMAIWMVLNVYILVAKPFDPYPFILLNLALSCLAAIQAPIIMMSQNRQEEKDRKRGQNDYKVNLKAELEIKLLNEKIDVLMQHQNKRFLEILEIQTDYLEEISLKVKA